jgi:hypothetical protein
MFIAGGKLKLSNHHKIFMVKVLKNLRIIALKASAKLVMNAHSGLLFD